MFTKIKNFFTGKTGSEEVCSLPYTDEYYDIELEKKKKRIELFREKVGESPLDDIDYIIENGYEEYIQLQKDCKEEVEKEYKEEKNPIELAFENVYNEPATLVEYSTKVLDQWRKSSANEWYRTLENMQRERTPDGECLAIDENRDFINSLDIAIESKKKRKGNQQVQKK